MTKLKSKKLSKSTIAIIILAISLVALLAFGSTFALFTATSKNVSSNNVKTGKVTVSASGAFVESTSKRIFPGESIVSTAIQVSPNTDAAKDANGQYVAVKIVLTLTQNGAEAAVADPSQYLTLNWYQVAAGQQATAQPYWAPTSLAGVYVFTGLGSDHTIYSSGTNPKDQSTLNAMSAGYMTASTEVLTGITFDGFDHAQEGDNGSISYTNNLMDATITVSVQFRSMQVTANTGKTVAEVANYLFGANTTQGTLDNTLNPGTGSGT